MKFQKGGRGTRAKNKVRLSKKEKDGKGGKDVKGKPFSGSGGEKRPRCNTRV